MLTSTFIQAPRVDYDTEQAIWNAGGRTWSRFLDCYGRGKMRGITGAPVAKCVEASIRAVEKRNVTFFSRKLEWNDQWRLYHEFRDRVAFVDIETTGFSPNYHEITVISLYDGYETRQFIRGKNLDEFRGAISDYSLIVTFNGSAFDLPFIQAELGSTVRIPPAHIDLRWAFKDVGITGGLKAIEKKFGIRRSGTAATEGSEAVKLWYHYKNGSETALETLLTYAQADVVNLEPLAYHACRLLAEQAGMPAAAFKS